MNCTKRLEKDIRVQQAELDTLYRGLNALLGELLDQGKVDASYVRTRLQAAIGAAVEAHIHQDRIDAEMVRNMEEDL